MKTATHAKRNVLLAGLGLVSLLIYVLACTSFSPDDSKVLFPAFDRASGGTSVMLYDRQSGKVEQVYVRNNPARPADTNVEARLVRPQWLSDGKHILVACAEREKDGGLELTVVPYGVREPIRFLRIANRDVAEGVLMMSLPVLGSEIFLPNGHKGLIALNLVTGKARFREFTNELGLWTGPEGRTLFCCMETGDKTRRASFGRLNPESLEFEPIMEIPNDTNLSEVVTYVATPGGQRLVLLGESREKGGLELEVFHAGKLEFSRHIESGAPDVRVGPAGQLSPNGDWLYTSYMRADSGKTNCEYGLLEVPLSRAAPRWTTLLRASEGDDGDVMFFQGGLSHDGRTWAVASAFLQAENPHVQDTDCALFLVDLKDPQRKVTKVQLPVPPWREKLK